MPNGSVAIVDAKINRVSDGISTTSFHHCGGGVAIHIGSQRHDLAPLESAYCRVGMLVAELRARGHAICRVDLGALGIPYDVGEIAPSLTDYAVMVDRVAYDWDVELTFEPAASSSSRQAYS